MPYDPAKILVAYNNVKIGEWLHGIRGQSALRIEGPVGVFISFEYKEKIDIKKANLMTYCREVVATLILERVIANTQQIHEIGFEKKAGKRNDVSVIIQSV